MGSLSTSGCMGRQNRISRSRGHCLIWKELNSDVEENNNG
jgi:hypothetical protein